ncbi:hypothetical protein V500_07311 [Pseudogymnoascus sp. VKM F-4518 (FW-2643)]|nr:hypothetical protein V500_07311 [Pseudogymnoascus sp. VKM F-4518 (FW-2643)]
MSTIAGAPLQTLKGKVAIVTGSSRGIGAAIALELAKRGAKVVITFVSPSSEKLADEVVSTINGLQNGAAAIKVQADMAQLESPKKIVDATLAAFGSSIDILVNNAGVECSKPLSELALADYNYCMDVNVRGVLFMTQAVIPHLQQPGRIINLGSVLGRVGNAGTSIYAASKAAVEGLTRGWASELSPLGHTVNTIAPGLTETDMMAEVMKKQGPAAEQALAIQKMLTPLEHRLGQAEDIALTVVMLAESNSRWITGQSIQASGGLYMN